MFYPNVSDPTSIPSGTPDRTLFVCVDNTWKQKGIPASLEDCARGYWTEANLEAAHAYDCDWLMARHHGKIVGVWKIDKRRWMVPSATPKKTWPNDNPTDHPRRGCILIPVDKEMEQCFIGKEVHLGRCPNSLRGYFIQQVPTSLNGGGNTYRSDGISGLEGK